MDSRGAGGNIDRPLKPIPAVRPKLDLVRLCRIGPFWFHIADLTEKGKAMRDDLLHAKAAVDWAVAKLPAFEERIAEWTGVNVDVEIEYTELPATHNLVVAVEKEALPLSFNVEAGVYINVIRTSLDILATTISARNRMSDNPQAHFPIYRSVLDFIDPKDGIERINWLSDSEREIIKTLKPYEGGNVLLWSLHQLDIMRKHRRLLHVEARFRAVHLIGQGIRATFEPVASGWITIDNKTILGRLKRGTPKPDCELSTYIAFDEAVLARIEPVIDTLRKFAGLAHFIIELFDTV